MDNPRIFCFEKCTIYLFLFIENLFYELPASLQLCCTSFLVRTLVISDYIRAVFSDYYFVKLLGLV